VEVVREETEEGAEEWGSDEGQGIVASEEGAQEGGGRGEEAHADGESIEAIDEIEGVGTGDKPEDGKGNVPPGAGDGVTRHGPNLDMRVTGQGGGGDLSEDLHPRLQTKDVIEETGGERDKNGREESPNAGKRSGNGARAPQRRVEEDQESDCVPAEDGDAAGAGYRKTVDLARARVV
jgi:hypothetical protein